jgi:hypothetical protein
MLLALVMMVGKSPNYVRELAGYPRSIQPILIGRPIEED